MDLCVTVCNENYEHFNCIYNLDKTTRHFRLKRLDLADVGKSSLISQATTFYNPVPSKQFWSISLWSLFFFL